MIGRKKKISGRGRGKWETPKTLLNYRITRNKKNKVAKASRQANKG